ncbi:hypothetical protein [Micromonospora costi]|uniref:Uncharacterized protein n=1 Tax=Micromonospora costi TaxID=1530042 RepID=A0A3B0AGV1_9ACTN|nr:hypothetical protein [Micromonospora costi]RKN58546.1 hypothetical protein D7193_08445 [Micromonospora costi]
MLDERELSALLRAEVDSAERPSTVLDVGRAMATGRRQRRLARSTGAALAVGVLVAAGLTVPGVLGPDRPPAPADTAAPGRATALPAALTVVEPDVVYVRFGWLPEGVRHLQYQAGLLLSGPGVHLAASFNETGEPWRGATVDLFPKGAQPPAPQLDDGSAAPLQGTHAGPDLHGGPSTFVSYAGTQRSEAILRWQYAPDGWAQVRVLGLPGDPEDTAGRVARTLTFGQEVLPMPVTLRGVPDTLRPITGDVTLDFHEPGSWYAGMTWSPEPPDADPGQQRARTLNVGFWPYRPATDPNGKGYVDPNTTIDGHPAALTGEGGMESLTVYGVAGINVSIDDDGLLPGGSRALFRRLGIGPSAADWLPHLYR